MSDEGAYIIRPYREADKSFIMATFLRGLYYGDTWFSAIPKDIFMDNYKKVGEALLVSPNVSIRVACLKDDNDVILGYSLLSQDVTVLHWIFVKSAFRKQGIGRRLTPPSLYAYTHLTTLGKSLTHKLPNAVFNPFKIL